MMTHSVLLSKLCVFCVQGVTTSFDTRRRVAGDGPNGGAPGGGPMPNGCGGGGYGGAPGGGPMPSDGEVGAAVGIVDETKLGDALGDALGDHGPSSMISPG